MSEADTFIFRLIELGLFFLFIAVLLLWWAVRGLKASIRQLTKRIDNLWRSYLGDVDAQQACKKVTKNGANDDGPTKAS